MAARPDGQGPPGRGGGATASSAPPEGSAAASTHTSTHAAETVAYGSTTVGIPTQVSDVVRSGTFYVDRFIFMGITLSGLYPGEPDIIQEILGTSIDPQVIADARSVNEALALIATNASNVCGARLASCHQRCAQLLQSLQQPTASPAALLPAPTRSESRAAHEGAASLETLPLAILQWIVCMTGSLRVVAALSATCRALHRPLLSEDMTRCGLAVPVCTRPGAHSCDASIVAWDEETAILRKTARIGHPLVIFSDEWLTGSTSAMLEVDIRSLGNGVGGVQLGLLAAVRTATSPAVPSVSAGDRCWIDGLGRLHLGASIATNHEWVHAPYGDRIRKGDRMGVLFIALREETRVGFTRDGKLLGPTIPLLQHQGAASRIQGYHFFIRFDTVEGIEAQLVRSRCTPVDVAATVRTRAPVRPPTADEPPLVVHTVGADSHGMGIALRPERATVGQLREACAREFGCSPPHVELRLQKQTNSKHAASMPLEDDAALLCSVGLRLQPNGCHMAELTAHVPHGRS